MSLFSLENWGWLDFVILMSLDSPHVLRGLLFLVDLVLELSHPTFSQATQITKKIEEGQGLGTTSPNLFLFWSV